jgi:hypothetical protein
MIKSGSHSRPTAIKATIQFLLRVKWIFCLAVAVLFTVAAAPPSTVSDENTDEEYIRIMNLTDRADTLRASGKSDAALAKDKEAYRALMIFKRTHPRWNPTTVDYRLNEITEEIENKPANESEESTRTKPKVSLEAPATASKSAVKLLDAGSEPKKVLRLHVKSGDKQTMIITIKMSMDMGMGGAAMSLPEMTIPMDSTVQSVAPNGDITYQMALEEPNVANDTNANPQMVQGIKTGLAAIKGLKLTGVFSDRGESKQVQVNGSGNANPSMDQTLDQIKEGMSMGAPLPEEAVGAGAKWEVDKPVKSGGVTVNQKATYELVSIDGDNLSTKLMLIQSAANQKVVNPALGGARINLIEMTNSASGTVASDLSKLMPLQGTMDMHSDMKGEVSVGDQKQPMEIKMDMNISMEGK